jgi:hypothetical protein
MVNLFVIGWMSMDMDLRIAVSQSIYTHMSLNRLTSQVRKHKHIHHPTKLCSRLLCRT